MTAEEIALIKTVIAESVASVIKGDCPNVAVLTTKDGRMFFQEAGAVQKEDNSPEPVSAVQKALASSGGLAREGTVLYSYGKPQLSETDLFVISKVVYIVDDKEFHKRGLETGEKFSNIIECVQFPTHPSFNALRPLTLWDEIYS